MTRVMGSSCVFTCWGAASWHGGRVMLVLGARAAAGAGSCAGVQGSAPFGVVVVCGCSLVTVLAGGVAPVCGSGCGPWWALSWREVCGVSRVGAGGVGCGVGVARLRSRVGGLWCPVSPGGGGGCGVVWWCCVVWWPSRWGGGGTVSRSGGVGCCPWSVLSRCGAGVLTERKQVCSTNIWMTTALSWMAMTFIWMSRPYSVSVTLYPGMSMGYLFRQPQTISRRRSKICLPKFKKSYVEGWLLLDR